MKMKSTWTIPFGVANTFSTLAYSMIGSRAKLSIISVAGEVIAFTIITGHNLETSKKVVMIFEN